MKYSIVRGVIMSGLQLPMRNVILNACTVFFDMKKNCIITSALDGVHSPESLHPFGYALDFRTRHLTSKMITKAKYSLKERLWRCSVYYDVVVCKNCLHAEYDIIRLKKDLQESKTSTILKH